MPVWITKQSPISEWGAIQFRVIMAQQELRSSLHLAMRVRRGELDHPDDVVILLPDNSLRTRFPGFTEIDENNIPAGLKLLVGTVASFSKRFPEVASKLNPQSSRDEVGAARS